jgi:hypothetical protein
MGKLMALSPEQQEVVILMMKELEQGKLGKWN